MCNPSHACSTSGQPKASMALPPHPVQQLRYLSSSTSSHGKFYGCKMELKIPKNYTRTCPCLRL